jgi:hypothetical protein
MTTVISSLRQSALDNLGFQEYSYKIKRPNSDFLFVERRLPGRKNLILSPIAYKTDYKI